MTGQDAGEEERSTTSKQSSPLQNFINADYDGAHPGNNRVVSWSKFVGGNTLSHNMRWDEMKVMRTGPISFIMVEKLNFFDVFLLGKNYQQCVSKALLLLFQFV